MNWVETLHSNWFRKSIWHSFEYIQVERHFFQSIRFILGVVNHNWSGYAKCSEIFILCGNSLFWFYVLWLDYYWTLSSQGEMLILDSFLWLVDIMDRVERFWYKCDFLIGKSFKIHNREVIIIRIHIMEVVTIYIVFLYYISIACS